MMAGIIFPDILDRVASSDLRAVQTPCIQELDDDAIYQHRRSLWSTAPTSVLAKDDETGLVEHVRIHRSHCDLCHRSSLVEYMTECEYARISLCPECSRAIRDGDAHDVITDIHDAHLAVTTFEPNPNGYPF
jgi:hypothetical protein